MKAFGILNFTGEVYPVDVNLVVTVDGCVWTNSGIVRYMGVDQNREWIRLAHDDYTLDISFKDKRQLDPNSINTFA